MRQRRVENVVFLRLPDLRNLKMLFSRNILSNYFFRDPASRDSGGGCLPWVELFKVSEALFFSSIYSERGTR